MSYFPSSPNNNWFGSNKQPPIVIGLKKAFKDFAAWLDGLTPAGRSRLNRVLLISCAGLLLFMFAMNGYIHVDAPIRLSFGIGEEPVWQQETTRIPGAHAKDSIPAIQQANIVPLANKVKVDAGVKIAKIVKPAKKTASANENSPISPIATTGFDAKGYINKYKNMAINSMNKYNVPASIILAQGLIEGRAGTSKLAVENNNHFGIKCFSAKCKKGHCTNATDDTHKDFFRKYKSVQECFNDHGKKLSNGRYAYLKKYRRDYRRWAFGLKACGYATDKTYAEKLIGVIQRYDLDRHDK